MSDAHRRAVFYAGYAKPLADVAGAAAYLSLYQKPSRTSFLKEARGASDIGKDILAVKILTRFLHGRALGCATAAVNLL